MASKAVEHAIDLDAGLGVSMVRRARSLEAGRCNNGLCTIYRIPLNIRNGDPNAYNPKILSIGPYHRCKKALRAMDACKWMYLRELLGPDLDANIPRCVEEIKRLEARARRCYSESIGLSSNAFVEMMVLDGCFIINFLIRRNSNAGDPGSQQQQLAGDPIYAVSWISPLIWHDLLMLENQIPFFILQAVYGVAHHNHHPTSPDLMTIAVKYFTNQSTEIPSKIYSHYQQVHHLLHLYHLFYQCQPPAPKPSQSGTYCWGFFPRCLRRSTSTEVELERSSIPRTIPSASQLKEAGVRFRKKKSENFLDVAFEGNTLKMAMLPIGHSTSPVSRNLIAFEQCCPSAGSLFTSYAVLMDCLVNTPKDVEILHGNGIIDNRLGSDKEAAILVNNVLKDIPFKAERNHYADLFKRVNAHCQSRCNRWRARLVRDYFGNPWTIVSLLAAIVLLVLTILQTTYTILPYYHPHS